MRASVWLVEIVMHNGTSTETLRLSTEGYTSRPSDSPANTYYEGRLSGIGSFACHLFGQGRTMGQVVIETGDLVVENADGALDYLIDYGFDGRAVTIKRLDDPRDALATAETVLRGSLEGVDSDNGFLRLRFRFYDRRRDLDRPIQQNFYGGTITGSSSSIDGPATLKGVPKPLVFGRCYNVPGVIANPFDLLIQVNDGPVSAITAYDGGVPLTYAGDYASISALRSASGNPGRYATCLAQGVWRPFGSFGGRPSFIWTADVDEGLTTTLRRPGAVATRMLTKLGISGGDIASATFTALDSAAPYQVGIYLERETSGLSAIREVLGSVGGYIAPNALGVFEAGRLSAPASSVGTLIEPDIITQSADESIAYTANPDTDGAVPTHRVVIRHSRNWHTHGESDLAACVAEGDPARSAALQAEYREEKAENAAVLVKHLLSRELIIDTLLTSQADAAAEATRRLALYGVSRKVIRVAAARDDAALMLPNATMTLELDRLCMAAGKAMVVIGREDDFEGETAILTVWG